MSSQVYATRVVDDMRAVDPRAWDALLAQQASPTPFLQHAYLSALRETGCAMPQTGWQMLVLLLEDESGLAGAAPLYVKSHSYGEYVFDWAWADAYRRHGLRYYPKLIAAVPFTPVPGTRLLATDATARRALARGIRQVAAEQGWSSAHALFVDEADHQALAEEGWMIRQGVQFHWQQPADKPLHDFDALLASLQRHKRKNILQEQRRVREAGVRFRAVPGPLINDSQWDFFHHCYTLTYQAHGSTPYLNRAFFAAMAEKMPQNWVMFIAERDMQPIAASLVAVDPERRIAYGRYWGCTQFVPHLHFDACYYQPLAWCLANGFQRFEGGAQGEHKMARGLLPVPTHSAHWIADERFASAVDDFLAREGAGMAGYLDELRDRTPFKRSAGPDISPSDGSCAS
jgi:predicted N-acyltransferase